MNRKCLWESYQYIEASFWFIINRNVWVFPIALRNQQCFWHSSQATPLHDILAAAAKPHEASQDRLLHHARVFPFSDYGHTFSSQSGLCKGNYTSQQDEILPKKEAKTHGCWTKYWLLCHNSKSTYLALNSFSADLMCFEATENF